MRTETTLQLKSLLALALVLLVFSASCGRQSLKVINMPPPDYPLQARNQGMQGVVVVTVGIGTDGKVNYANGQGTSWLFVHAAEENAKGWLFQVPPRARFPLQHQIKYTFTIDKEGGWNLNPRVVTNLPDAVEIIATPAAADEFILVPDQPSKKSAEPGSPGHR